MHAHSRHFPFDGIRPVQLFARRLLRYQAAATIGTGEIAASRHRFDGSLTTIIAATMIPAVSRSCSSYALGSARQPGAAVAGSAVRDETHETGCDAGGRTGEDVQFESGYERDKSRVSCDRQTDCVNGVREVVQEEADVICRDTG